MLRQCSKNHNGDEQQQRQRHHPMEPTHASRRPVGQGMHRILRAHPHCRNQCCTHTGHKDGREQHQRDIPCPLQVNHANTGKQRHSIEHGQGENQTQNITNAADDNAFHQHSIAHITRRCPDGCVQPQHASFSARRHGKNRANNGSHQQKKQHKNDHTDNHVLGRTKQTPRLAHDCP